LDKPNLKVGSETFSCSSNTEKIWYGKAGECCLRIIPVCAKLELVDRVTFGRAREGM
jgi:hypothetical protein